MKISASFLGFCDHAGHIALPDRKGFERFVRASFLGREFVIEVRDKTNQRSHAQLRWWWGVALPAIAESCGYDAHEHEQLHEDILSVRFGTHAIAPRVPGASPRIEPTKRTRDLSTKEMAELMEWLARWAADTLNVVLPLPNEWMEAA